MDKQKVNTTSSMKRKGYSSSSHYRINSVVGKSEQVLAIKFVQWDVPSLESLCNSKVYLLRVKLYCGERMSREEKNWLYEAVNSNTYFRTAVPLQGYRFDFFDVLKKYLVKQYGQWTEYYAPDRTSLRAYLYGRINQIVELKIGESQKDIAPPLITALTLWLDKVSKCWQLSLYNGTFPLWRAFVIAKYISYV